MLFSLDIKKVPDGISITMLQVTAHSIAGSLVSLFNPFLKSGHCPTDWKFARIVPIPKAGDPQSPTNYTY